MTNADVQELESKFGELSEGSNNLLRFSKKLDRDFFVTTFVTKRALDASELLSWRAYQDGPVADYYYRNPGPSQWNIYLYLVVEPSARIDLRTRLKVENDREFARKRIVTPEELSSIVRTDIGARFGAEHSGIDLMEQWRQCLGPVSTLARIPGCDFVSAGIVFHASA